MSGKSLSLSPSLLKTHTQHTNSQQEDATFSASRFREASRSVDTSRPVTANDATFGAPTYLDVQGFSHSNNKTFETFHDKTPSQPTILSECCSCESDRLKDRDLTSCIADQNSPGIQNKFVSGSIGVWTLMDYFGEPSGTGTSSWPVVSSDFGNFDIAGFPKSHAWWYTANWLEGVSDDKSRPPVPRRTVVKILSLPDDENNNVATVLSTAPFVEVLIDGEPVSGGCTKSSRDSYGTSLLLSLSLSLSLPKLRTDFPILLRICLQSNVFEYCEFVSKLDIARFVGLYKQKDTW